jgi:polyhydroxyalkanoate depolymerase
MMYQHYQAIANASDPVRKLAETSQSMISYWPAAKNLPYGRWVEAYLEQVSLMGLTHQRPPFLIDAIENADGSRTHIEETTMSRRVFCDLVRFKKKGAEDLPRVLLVAPMSGHFATLLRGTVQTLVQDHDVYLTDWLNIRDIPMSAGKFDLDAYIDEIIESLHVLGPGAHLMGVCQPTVACLAAASLMSEDNDPCLPLSLTLMAGPIDTRINPTQVNELAMTKPIEWFEKNLCSHVPLQFSGAGRKVYPGFVQLSAFMNMNLERHQKSFKDLFDLRLSGEEEKANAIRDFYQEYFAIMDLSAPFYLETVEKVFQKHLLPKGELTYKDRLVNPAAIRKIFLMTVEGERDDICGIGQTLAAQDLCNKLPAYKKTHHLQAGVGHYGVFSGRRWASQIYPVVRNLIQSVT